MQALLKRKRLALLAALVACAALFFASQPGALRQRGQTHPSTRARTNPPRGFVKTDGAGFSVDGRPFRFVGANVAVTYGDGEREHMLETLRAAARDGVGVIRVWAHGEVGEENTQPDGAGASEWLRANPFRRGADDWNEAAFVHLDRVLAEAARLNLRAQLCLINWWPDTGGVTQYLAWAGIRDAFDKSQPHNVNIERAMLFYSDEQARRLYRQHVEKIVARRNTVTGVLYRDDPTILGYELMNEAQAPAGREAERRAWVAEMSAYVKSLDPNHLVTPGLWGYRNSRERREWLAAHDLPDVDYCDVHVYPRDDLDSYIDSPAALRAFIDNRAAAALSIGRPLVVGEFGIPPEGLKGLSQPEWFRAYFDDAARAGAGGAMFWILTHDPARDYGVSYTTARDDALRAGFARAARLLETTASLQPPPDIRDDGRHLIPRQFAFARDERDASALPLLTRKPDDATLIYGFAPEQAASGRFEKLGGGAGYIWGDGIGFFEYRVPPRDGWRRVGEVTVRAYLQPTPPADARGRIDATRVTLFIDGHDCGSRLVSLETKPRATIHEWRTRSLAVLASAARGRPLNVRFAVTLDADQPFGLTISNFPEGFDAYGASPVEVELR